MDEPIIEILAIGDELTQGRTTDTNSGEIARALAALGLTPAAFHQAGDDLAEIASILGNILDRANVCLCTGGLGPTLDDITREAVAFACGAVLRVDTAALENIRAYFARMGREMPNVNRRQAMFPEGAEVLPNNHGTAPGFAIDCGRTLIICLPGVPREMRAMLGESAMPLLKKRFGEDRHVAVKILRLFGIPESSLAEALGDLMARGKNPSVGTNASAGVISVVIRARAASAPEAASMLAETESQVRALVGKYIFGEGDITLAEAVAALLEKRNLTIATAESCTGGLLGSMLTDVPGISRFFIEGTICYSNEAKTRLLKVPADLIASKGAVSAEVAYALARCARDSARADIGVGITGIAGPSGGTPEKPVGLVFIAVADERGVDCREFHVAGDREIIRRRASLAALNMVRVKISPEA